MTGSAQGEVRFWNAETGRLFRSVRGVHSSYMHRIRFANGEKQCETEEANRPLIGDYGISAMAVRIAAAMTDLA